MKDENREESLGHCLNAATDGPISSDSIGMNLSLDRFAAKGNIKSKSLNI